MALVFCDGADSYAATADLSKKWGSVGADWAWNSTAGRTGGGGIVGGTTGGTNLVSRNVFPVTTAPVGMAFWFKISSAPASVSNILAIQNSANATVCNIAVATSGGVHFRTNINTVAGSVSVNIADNAFHWIEAHFNVLLSAATMKLYVDSVEVTNGAFATNATGQTGNSQTFIFPSLAGKTITIDDIIAYDNSGSFTLSGIPYGPREITTLRPTSDSAVQFARSTGADNFALIDEVNGDIADYVQSGTSSEQDLYGYGNLGFTPATVNAVMLNSYLHNPNAGTINHKQIAKSSATTTEGASVVTPAAAVVLQQPFYTDPNGGGAWSGSAVDAALFGIKVV